MSRNKDYEQRQKTKGRNKVTIWVPKDRESDIKQAVAMMLEDDSLTINVLRNQQTGRLVSMHQK
ncbi:hypothetical protein O1O06_16330 [Grimontia hollisae]|nr:hypothetical protein [Grimontia hollisae]MDF2186309.1 hypothetical protein [Grimontia hollisae]